MRIGLTPGWTVQTSGHELILRSEETELKVNIGAQAGLAAQLIADGWGHSDAPGLKPLREELLRRRIVSPFAQVASPDQSRQIEFWRAFTPEPHEAVKRIVESTVSIIGLGGVGTVVLEHLVAAGVRKFRLLDMDSVDESNMNRQFIFTRGDFLAPKVAVARAYVLARRPDAEIEVAQAEWDSSDDRQQRLMLSGSSVVVSAIDKPDLRAAVDVLELAWRNRIPSIMVAVGLHRALVSPVLDPDHSTIEPGQSVRVLSSGGEAPFLASHGPANTVPAAIAADQILHHLAALSDHVDYQKPLVLRRDLTGGYHSTRVPWVTV